MASDRLWDSLLEKWFPRKVRRAAKVEGKVVSLDDKAHQAEVKYSNEKGYLKVVKRS
jgi:hypothetical protein